MDTSKNPPFMFEHPVVDYFFRWRWWAAPVVFLPISALLLWYAEAFLDVSLASVITCMLAGVLMWTCFEYCMHRFLFHFIGKSQQLKHIHYVVHGMHHAHPTNPVRVIFPPFGSCLMGSVVAIGLYILMPLYISALLFSGFILGYVWYEFMHYAAHQIKWKLPYFKRLKRHHLLHHHSGAFQNKNFGVTTSLWDRVFGTHLV